ARPHTARISPGTINPSSPDGCALLIRAVPAFHWCRRNVAGCGPIAALLSSMVRNRMAFSRLLALTRRIKGSRKRHNARIAAAPTPQLRGSRSPHPNPPFEPTETRHDAKAPQPKRPYAARRLRRQPRFPDARQLLGAAPEERPLPDRKLHRHGAIDPGAARPP